MLRLQAADAYNAGMQYTLRNISKQLDRAVRQRAKSEGKSVNQTLLEAVQRGLGLNGEPRTYHDLDWFFGGKSMDEETLRVIAEADVVHPDDWR
jgi:hypothetical protein